MAKTRLTKEDYADLKRAKELGESEPFAIQVTNLLGMPIAKALEALPDKAEKIIAKATNKSLEKAFQIALVTMGKGKKESSNLLHKMLVAASGGVGGALGFPALPVELPISTTIMLRSIADIARSEGENLSSDEARLNCVAVFGLEGGKSSDDDADTGFYASRLAMAAACREAAEYLAKKGAENLSAPFIIKLIEQIAARFGITVSEKTMAQAIPVIGAAMGATINVLFIDYYQKMARGHFILRRLERKYSPELIHQEYDAL